MTGPHVCTGFKESDHYCSGNLFSRYFPTKSKGYHGAIIPQKTSTSYKYKIELCNQS